MRSERTHLVDAVCPIGEGLSPVQVREVGERSLQVHVCGSRPGRQLDELWTCN